MSPPTITVSLSQIAKLIDHALLQPNLTDAEIDAGLAIAKEYNVAAACIKPYSIPAALSALAGTDVLVCAVIGFPHGNSTTNIKVAEGAAAMKAGADEIDVVVNVGKVLGGEWGYVADEIRAVNEAVMNQGGILKVIFENAYLQDEHIVRLCEICTEIGVAFVKTSTGYGYVKGLDGSLVALGATVPHVRLMKANVGPDVKVKAAGGVRSLDDLLYMLSLGVSRIGASGTVSLIAEAKKRGITDQPTEVELKAESSSDPKAGY
jgi:deoxyribose-phosphate aldolase